METKVDRKGKTRREETTRLLVVLVLIFGILGGFFAYLAWPVMVGKTVVLETRNVDPFDPLRGQYLILNYEIGRIPVLEGIGEGDNVYVSLKKNVSVWDYDGVSVLKPEGVFIKGKVTSIRREIMNVEYGIEQYFFERNAKFDTRGLTVEIKISSSGNARIVKLFSDGNEVIY